MSLSSRRSFMLGGLAAAGAGALALAPTKAEAVFFALFLRAFSVGRLGAGAGAASSLAGRTLLRGSAPVRPLVTEQRWNSYRQSFQTAQWVLRAGRLMRTDGNSYDVAYNDSGEYSYDVARYPNYFETVGARLSIGNSDPCNTYHVEDSDLQLYDDHVWQSYSVPCICVPPGGRTEYFAMRGVPTGWGYAGSYATDDDSITSNYLPVYS